MRQPDVLFVIEHVARELSIACAIRHLARQQHGLRVDIAPLANIANAAGRPVTAGVIAVPSFSSRKDFGIKHLLKLYPAAPLVNVACEQLLSPANRRYRLPRDVTSQRHVLHLAAGEFFRTWLTEAGVAEANVAVVGSMAMQLCQPPYSQMFAGHRQQLAETHGLDPAKPWLLLPENFGAAFFTRSHIRGRVRKGYDAKELAAYVRYAKLSLREIACWCAAASRSADCEIIVRPRPATAKTSLVAAFERAAGPLPSRNLHFIKEGDVRHWIHASDVVASSYSTTLVEAAVSRKPTLLLAPCPVPASAASEWHAVTPTVRSQAEFVDAVKRANQLQPTDPLTMWAMRNLLPAGDAIANVTQVLADVATGNRQRIVPPRPASVNRWCDAAEDGLRRAEQMCRAVVRPRRRSVFGHECDALDTASVDRLSEQWAQILAPPHSTAASA